MSDVRVDGLSAVAEVVEQYETMDHQRAIDLCRAIDVDFAAHVADLRHIITVAEDNWAGPDRSAAIRAIRDLAEAVGIWADEIARSAANAPAPSLHPPAP